MTALRSLAAPMALVLMALATSAGCGPGGIQSPPPTTADDDTRLGVGDIFQVRVYGEADLSSNYRVEPDGSIDYPYLGRVEVVGLEPPAVADLLEERLRDGGVLVDPQVSVLVTETPSRRVSVTGAVRNPGNYPISPGLTALQAVGLAGGTTDLAARNDAIVTRRVDGQLRRYAVPLDSITVGAHEDFRVQANDIIYVPERPF